MKKQGLCLAVLTALICASFAGCGTEFNPEDYIELGQYKNLPYTKLVHEVTQQEIDDELDLLLSSYSTKEEITDRTDIQFGDIANIDYAGTLDGVPFAGGTAAGYDLEIGSGRFIDGFEDGLVGVCVGETVDLPLTFPDPYVNNEELSGAEVIFTVTVNSISKAVKPELTDELITEISQGQYTTADDYLAALEEQISAEYNEYNDLQMYSDLWQIVLDNATLKVDLPEELLNEQIQKMEENAKVYAENYNLEYEDFLQQMMGLTPEEFKEQTQEYAVTAAKQELVLQLIAQKENIFVSAIDLQKAMEEYISLYNYKDEKDFREQTDMEEFEEYILTSKVQDFIVENADITEKADTQ